MSIKTFIKSCYLYFKNKLVLINIMHLYILYNSFLVLIIKLVIFLHIKLILDIIIHYIYIYKIIIFFERNLILF